jgi:diguanylate cyclase (GGDEF)-like protein/PAS domain S-box-containing protein
MADLPEGDQPAPVPTPDAGEAALATAWTSVLQDSSFSSLERPGIERFAVQLTRRLVRAVFDGGSTGSAGQHVGQMLVRNRFTGSTALSGTVELIGDLLPGCGSSGAGAEVRARVCQVQGAVADGYTQALLALALSEQEQIRRAALVARDQAEAALRTSEARFRAVFTDAAVGIGLGDVEGRILEANPALVNMLGYDLEQFQQRNVTEFMHPDDAELVWLNYRELVEGRRESLWAEKRFYRCDGTTIWTHLTLSLIRGSDGAPRHQMVIIEDVTDRRLLQDRLAYQASHDSLTGLPNRALFLERLGEALDRTSGGPPERVGLCLLDLDSFKVINDSLGHLVGDQLLAAIARRLADCVPAPGLMCRLGGDEFVALVSSTTSRSELEDLTSRMLAAAARPVDIDGHLLSVTASIGVVEAPAGASSPTDLIRAADITLQEAKAEGKGRVLFHDPDRGATQVTLYTLAATLPGALERGEFTLRYQPLVRLRENSLRGVEVLLRWRHPRFGMLSPEHFIQLAEETGAILALGRWTLFRACEEVAARDDLPDDLLISVNVSVRQLQHSTFVGDVVHALARSGLPAHRLQLEVTESGVMTKEANGPLAALRRLARLGVRIAVDDFGTGYSNFVYLRRLPVHELKLDGGFLDGLRPGREADPVDLHVINTLVKLAHGLGLTVTAEAVETADQADRLRELHCDTGQGWYFGRPMTLDALAAHGGPAPGPAGAGAVGETSRL